MAERGRRAALRTRQHLWRTYYNAMITSRVLLCAGRGRRASDHGRAGGRSGGDGAAEHLARGAPALGRRVCALPAGPRPGAGQQRERQRQGQARDVGLRGWHYERHALLLPCLAFCHVAQCVNQVLQLVCVDKAQARFALCGLATSYRRSCTRFVPVHVPCSSSIALLDVAA